MAFPAGLCSPCSLLKLILALGILASPGAPPARAGVELHPSGRQIRTNPKLPVTTSAEAAALHDREVGQANAAKRGELRSGRTFVDGRRRIHAYPALPVSVGLVGCPACWNDYGVLGGVFLDVGPRVDGLWRSRLPRWQAAPRWKPRQ